ncbi:hypothetical protein SUGI_0728310 [Cryptomeria japonica]|nr:hypothetical protein SUGI_0728310 [Cryptomeria japonica]
MTHPSIESDPDPMDGASNDTWDGGTLQNTTNGKCVIFDKPGGVKGPNNAKKVVVYKCNMAGNPSIITLVVNNMTDNLRPTRVEAIGVANVVISGMYERMKIQVKILRQLSYFLQALHIFNQLKL